MGPRAGLDRCENSRPPTGIRSPDRPARSESLYRLSYPGPRYGTVRSVTCEVEGSSAVAMKTTGLTEI
jgi:hypothetical protein